MNRIAITDGDGAWFDLDEATGWAEDTFTDGNGHRVSSATLDQWTHEHLYRTRKGNYILNEWANGSASNETYRPISPERAAAWLMQNTEEVPEELTSLLEGMEI